MDLADQRICVTGASGFLGYHLTSALLNEGARVLAMDIVENPKLSMARATHGKLTFVRSDIQRPAKGDFWSDLFAVIHLASLAEPRLCNSDPDLAFRINVEGVKEVLRLSSQAQRFVFASTCMVYGEQAEIPIRENAAPNAKDVYALTKLIGEDLCKIFHYRYGLPYTILRFGNSYGPFQSQAYLIPSLINQALEEGKIEVWDPKPIRDFTYVVDTVQAIVRVLKTEVTANEVLNIGTGRGQSTKEIARILSGLLNVPWVQVDKKMDVVSKLVVDISKVKSLTGWSPKFSHEEGLRSTVDHYLQEKKVSLTRGART